MRKVESLLEQGRSDQAICAHFSLVDENLSLAQVLRPPALGLPSLHPIPLNVAQAATVQRGCRQLFAPVSFELHA